MKIYGIDKLAEMVEAENRMNALVKQAETRRIKELVEEGIDKKLARTMVKTGCVDLFN